MRRQFTLVLLGGAIIAGLGLLGFIFGPSLLGSNTTTSTTCAISGLETVEQNLTMLRGCSEGDVLVFQAGRWCCGAN